MHIKKFLLPALFLFTVTAATAQKKPVKKPTVAFKKIKPPKLITSLDDSRDSVLDISTAEAERLIAMPLKIYDDKKHEYMVTSYQFLYKRKGVTEDEEGKVSGTTTVISDRFKNTPLPELWTKIVREQVKSGEELYFFDIIAKDAEGRVMYAPGLKLMIR